MAGIYSRDQINYGGMLGNAMANRMAYAQRDADIQRQMGQNWANAINQGAQGIAAGLNTWNQQRIDQDKLAQQQQFQAEQRALERANELKRAQEQQKWQAEQNALQRQSTENIAALNRNATANQQSAEKQAQSIMHYDIQKGIVDSLANEIMRTDDPSKLAQLYRQRDEALAKMNYYAASVPEAYKGPKVGESFPGFTFGMGQDNFKPQEPKGQQQAQPASDGKPNSVKLSEYVAAGNNAKTSKDAEAALANMDNVDRSFLNKAENEQFEKDRAALVTRIKELKKAEKNEADYQAALKAVGNNAFKRAEVKKKYGRK
jgi:hypothetical protein